MKDLWTLKWNDDCHNAGKIVLPDECSGFAKIPGGFVFAERSDAEQFADDWGWPCHPVKLDDTERENLRTRFQEAEQYAD